MSLKKKGIKLLAIEQAEGSVELQNLQIENDQRYALVFGHEVNGVDQEVVNICDYLC